MIVNDDILCHHGIQGQRWGVRRFQEPDGDLTPAGRERYGVGKKRVRTNSGDAENNKNRTRTSKSKRLFKVGPKFSTRVVRGGAIAASILLAASTVYASAKFMNRYGSPKAQADVNKLFDAFKYDRFEPNAFKYDRFEPNRFEPKRLK